MALAQSGQKMAQKWPISIQKPSNFSQNSAVSAWAWQLLQASEMIRNVLHWRLSILAIICLWACSGATDAPAPGAGGRADAPTPGAGQDVEPGYDPASLKCRDLFTNGGMAAPCCPKIIPDCTDKPEGYPGPNRVWRCVQGPTTESYCSCQCLYGQWSCGC